MELDQSVVCVMVETLWCIYQKHDSHARLVVSKARKTRGLVYDLPEHVPGRFFADLPSDSASSEHNVCQPHKRAFRQKQAPSKRAKLSPPRIADPPPADPEPLNMTSREQSKEAAFARMDVDEPQSDSSLSDLTSSEDDSSAPSRSKKSSHAPKGRKQRRKKRQKEKDAVDHGPAEPVARRSQPRRATTKCDAVTMMMHQLTQFEKHGEDALEGSDVDSLSGLTEESVVGEEPSISQELRSTAGPGDEVQPDTDNRRPDGKDTRADTEGHAQDATANEIAQSSRARLSRKAAKPERLREMMEAETRHAKTKGSTSNRRPKPSKVSVSETPLLNLPLGSLLEPSVLVSAEDLAAKKQKKKKKKGKPAVLGDPVSPTSTDVTEEVIEDPKLSSVKKPKGTKRKRDDHHASQDQAATEGGPLVRSKDQTTAGAGNPLENTTPLAPKTRKNNRRSMSKRKGARINTMEAVPADANDQGTAILSSMPAAEEALAKERHYGEHVSLGGPIESPMDSVSTAPKKKRRRTTKEASALGVSERIQSIDTTSVPAGAADESIDAAPQEPSESFIGLPTDVLPTTFSSSKRPRTIGKASSVRKSGRITLAEKLKMEAQATAEGAVAGSSGANSQAVKVPQK